jgi:hypothetical protein
MVRKKMEGNEDQRRAKARDAKKHGRTASEQGETLGASKQRQHLPQDEEHAEKLEAIHRGKQPDPGQHVSEPEPRPRSRP